MFLSSHVLTEVEATCDRVGILRSGLLVDQGSLSELRHLSAQSIDVLFDGPAPRLAVVPGVAVHSTTPNGLHLEVSGELPPLLAELAGHRVISLVSRPPSLEELFLHHYDAADEHSHA